MKKGYVEQQADASRRRATALSADTQPAAAVCAHHGGPRRTAEALLRDLDPDVREGVVSVIRRLAHAADARFRSGVSGGRQELLCAGRRRASRCR